MVACRQHRELRGRPGKATVPRPGPSAPTERRQSRTGPTGGHGSRRPASKPPPPGDGDAGGRQPSVPVRTFTGRGAHAATERGGGRLPPGTPPDLAATREPGLGTAADRLRLRALACPPRRGGGHPGCPRCGRIRGALLQKGSIAPAHLRSGPPQFWLRVQGAVGEPPRERALARADARTAAARRPQHLSHRAGVACPPSAPSRARRRRRTPVPPPIRGPRSAPAARPAPAMTCRPPRPPATGAIPVRDGPSAPWTASRCSRTTFSAVAGASRSRGATARSRASSSRYRASWRTSLSPTGRSRPAPATGWPPGAPER